jgi:serine/threonine protein kinase
MNTAHEDRLNEVLLAYVEALQEGNRPDRALLLAAHPELREDLEAFFAGHDEVERLAAPVRAATLPPVADLGQLGDFRLLREVGRGGMGVVYEAEQISLRRRVALTVLPVAAALDSRQLQRFKNEALAAAHLRHENIVPVHAVGCERGVHFYAMQFIDGQSLAALISERRRAGQGRGDQATVEMGGSHPTLPLEMPASSYCRRVAELGRQAALALEHAHSMGVVHRDVKPGNLLLDERGQLWVADFGLAQVSGDPGLTATGEVLGTLRYASPEQVQARRGVVDHRSDVYSLGATLYELVALRPLFDGRDRNELLRQIANEDPPSPRSLVPGVPEDLETIILKALRKDPAERYATAAELADDLERFLDHRPVLARRPGVVDHVKNWARRYPSVVVACVVGLLLLTVSSVVSAVLLCREQEKTAAAYRAERLRAVEAEERFRLARRSVDELVQISEEELASLPGLGGVRRRVLRSALAFYQEFIELRKDDPAAQAELIDARARVEKVLADLAVLQAANKLHLLCQPAVIDELRLEGPQRGRMKGLTMLAGHQWRHSFRDIGRLPPAERQRRAIDQARANEAEANAILSPAQRRRLEEIALQAEGLGAFRQPEVVAALSLSSQQREHIQIIEEAQFGWMRQPPEAKPAAERVLEVLTEEQAAKWRRMTGKPVKGLLGPFGKPAR